MNQIQHEQYTGKGGIYQQLTLPISENILIDEHEPVYVANAQLEELPALLDARRTNISAELFLLCIAFDLQKFFSKLQRGKRKSHLFPLKKE